MPRPALPLCLDAAATGELRCDRPSPARHSMLESQLHFQPHAFDADTLWRYRDTATSATPRSRLCGAAARKKRWTEFTVRRSPGARLHRVRTIERLRLRHPPYVTCLHTAE
eukprot:gene9828-biopygen7684